MSSVLITLRHLGPLTIALFCALLGNFAYSAWTAPTAPPPGANVPAPINTGTALQTKTGGLGVNRFWINHENPLVYLNKTVAGRDWRFYAGTDQILFQLDRDNDGVIAGAETNTTLAPFVIGGGAAPDGSADYIRTVGQVRAQAYCDRDGNNCFTAAGGGAMPGGLGFGQTWQDVTASRQCGISYTNDTGKPIMISARIRHHGWGARFDIGALQKMQVTGSHEEDGTWVAQLIIPVGETYRLRCENINPGSVTLEFRQNPPSGPLVDSYSTSPNGIVAWYELR